MGPQRYGKDMLLFKLFVSTAPTPDPEKSAAAETMSRMGFRCAECVLCEEHTLEDAAELHERSLDQLMEAIHAVPDPKLEDSNAWQMLESVKKLEQEHSAALQKCREEAEAGLAAARAAWTNHPKPMPRRGEGLLARMARFLRRHRPEPPADEKLWQVLEKMLQAQELFERKRRDLVRGKFGAALDEALVAAMVERKFPDVLSAFFPLLERHPEELRKWAAVLAGSPPAAGGAPEAGGAEPGDAAVPATPADSAAATDADAAHPAPS